MERSLTTLSVMTISILVAGCMTPYRTTTMKSTSYSAKYDISLWKVERPEKATQRYGSQKVDSISGDSKYRFLFEDNLVRILWLATSRTIAFSLENKTDYSIKIPWDEAAYVDENGRSHRVMHSGVKYSEREKPQAPSIVVRKGTIEDIVQPTHLVYYREGYYGRYTSTPGGWEEKPLLVDYDYHGTYLTGTYSTFDAFDRAVKSNVGKTYQVLLPLQIEDVINDYIFTFRVESVTTKLDSSSTTY
jgi:hypothetical protein